MTNIDTKYFVVYIPLTYNTEFLIGWA